MNKKIKKRIKKILFIIKNIKIDTIEQDEFDRKGFILIKIKFGKIKTTNFLIRDKYKPRTKVTYYYLDIGLLNYCLSIDTFKKGWK
ncbi:MAG: hypothetical protein ACOC1P_00635 [Minisyncoccales bacterium]